MNRMTFENKFFPYLNKVKESFFSGKVDFGVWYLMNDDSIYNRFKGLQKRYPRRNLYPFAKRDDNDDIACFEKIGTETIYIIHDFSDEGWEQRKTFFTIDEFLLYAKECNVYEDV